MSFAKIQRPAAVLGLTAILALSAVSALAQQFPPKVIKIIIPFGAGGNADSIVRLYGQKMSELLSAPVIIENKPGGAQLIGIRALKASPPDGSTLLAAVGSALVQNPALRKRLSYDPLKDFSLLGLLATNPGVIFINPDLPVHSIGELVAYSTSHPGELNYGSAGIGTAGHLHAEALFSLTGIKMTHVPYGADAEVIREVMAGRVHMGIMTTTNTVSFAQAGKIRALAVEATQRLPYLPEVPTVSETAVKGLGGLEPHTFVSLVGPAGMPATVVAQLNEAINKVSTMPDVVERVRDTLYAEPVTTTPASFREFLEKEIAKWKAFGKTVELPDLN
jgi:tripartite-type tricarboxylate transporter receptor subunit TctC